MLNQATYTWMDSLYLNSTGRHHRSVLSQTMDAANDLNGTALSSVVTSTVYDAYDNATSVVITTGTTGDIYSKTTTNTFMNDTANWFLGRLLRSTVQSTAP
jgi:hypothetical protein